MAGRTKKPRNVTVLYDRHEYSDETSDGIEDIPQEIFHYANGKEVLETLAGNFVRLTKELETSFEKERVGLTSNFETEKDDLMKGFLLEKEVLSKQHRKEKQVLIENFMKERQEMFRNFQKQVKDIEREFRQQISEQSSTGNSLSATSKETSAYASLRNPDQTPRDFLANLELQDHLESERERMEKQLRTEKGNFKKRIESEYEQKFVNEKHRYEVEVDSLKADIDHLKAQQLKASQLWKEDSEKMEKEFNRRLNICQNQLDQEKASLLRSLERKHASEIQEQQKRYEGNIGELKREIKKLTEAVDASRHRDAISGDHLQMLKRQVGDDMRKDFDRETRSLRQLNDQLNEEIKSLTSEKYELTRQVRELETEKNNNSKILKENTAKLASDCEEKTRKAMVQYEKLKVAFQQSVQEKQVLQEKLVQLEAEERSSQERNLNAERTLTECEDVAVSLRNENKTLSHEIQLLRHEKEEIKKQIEGLQTSERNLRTALSTHESLVEESSGRYAMLEREKLQVERMASCLRKEINDLKRSNTDFESKAITADENANRLRKLLESERSENQRLHERFRQDAETIRKKDAEMKSLAAVAESLKQELSQTTRAVTKENAVASKKDAEIRDLQLQLQKMKIGYDLQRKTEEAALQNKYVTEFTKRTDYLTETNNREIRNLKGSLQAYKRRVANLENALTISGVRIPTWDVRGVSESPSELLCSQHSNNCDSKAENLKEDFLITRDVGQVSRQSESSQGSTDRSEKRTKHAGHISGKTDEGNVRLIAPISAEHLYTSRNADGNNSVPSKPCRTLLTQRLPSPTRISQAPEQLASMKTLSSRVTDCRSSKLRWHQSYQGASPRDIFSSADNENMTSQRCSREGVPLSEASQSRTSSPIGVCEFESNRIVSPTELHDHCADIPPIRPSLELRNYRVESASMPTASHHKLTVAHSACPQHLGKSCSCLRSPSSETHDSAVTKSDGSSKSLKKTLPNSSGGRIGEVGGKTPHGDTKQETDLRKLLADVRKEVCLLNKLIDDKASSAGTTPTPEPGRPSSSLLKHLPLPELKPGKPMLPDQVNDIMAYADELQNQLSEQVSETEDSREVVKRLSEENSELHRRLDERERAMHEQEHTFDELFQRRMTLEKLVERLQTKLREESSRRRRLEQERNAINETSRELLEVLSDDEDYII